MTTQTLTLMVEVLRTAPTRLALAMTEWRRRLHDPEDFDGQPFCLRCGTPAPCEEWMGAAEAAHRLRRDLP